MYNQFFDPSLQPPQNVLLQRDFCQCLCVQAQALQLYLTLCNPPGSLSIGFFRQEYWGGLPFPPPGDLPDTPLDKTQVHWPKILLLSVGFLKKKGEMASFLCEYMLLANSHVFTSRELQTSCWNLYTWDFSFLQVGTFDSFQLSCDCYLLGLTNNANSGSVALLQIIPVLCYETYLGFLIWNHIDSLFIFSNVLFLTISSMLSISHLFWPKVEFKYESETLI